MQLYAQDNSGKFYFADTAEKQRDYYCCECGSIVRLRSGLYRHPHFYHIQPNRSCALSGKSMEHLQVQYRLSHLLPAGECTLECPFPSIKRIADVAWLSRKLIFEVQCSGISADEVHQRNSDYASVGFQVIWILHDRRFNQKRLSAAEDYLKTQPIYFTNIDEKGEGEIYDQCSLINRGMRKIFLNPLQVNLSHPQIMIKDISTHTIPFAIKMRQECWPLYFTGDAMDCYINDKDPDYINHMRALENTEKTTQGVPWYKKISYFYKLGFQILLEKACK